MARGSTPSSITASGCGTTVKDYGFMLRSDPAYAAKAARISALAKDICEYLARLRAAAAGPAANGIVAAYHGACSLQHGQKITREPKELLSKSGFVVKDVPEGHLCCGSAGTYNILQPDIARRLRARKVAQYREAEARCDRGRQCRLHHADRGGHGDPGGPSGRTDRLGDRRTAARGADGELNTAAAARTAEAAF